MAKNVLLIYLPRTRSSATLPMSGSSAFVLTPVKYPLAKYSQLNVHYDSAHGDAIIPSKNDNAA